MKGKTKLLTIRNIQNKIIGPLFLNSCIHVDIIKDKYFFNNNKARSIKAKLCYNYKEGQTNINCTVSELNNFFCKVAKIQIQ